LYSLKIKPDDFEHIISASIHEPFSLFVLGHNICDDLQKITLNEQVTGYSISVFLLVFTNILEYQFLKMLNVKDLLDLFFYDKYFESDEIMMHLEQLSFFNCENQKEFINPLASLASNLYIKSFFINIQGKLNTLT
jgi:hypothetical protein